MWFRLVVDKCLKQNVGVVQCTFFKTKELLYAVLGKLL